MAMNWTMNGENVTAVDLNSTFIEQSRRRFDSFGLKFAIGDQLVAIGGTHRRENACGECQAGQPVYYEY